MKLFELTGKVALITGSSRGIGRAIAEAMAAAGAKVVISSRKQDACDQVAAEINARHGDGAAIAVAASISSKDALQALVDTARGAFGRIDVLVCNAASNPYYGPMKGISDEQFRKVFENNVLACDLRIMSSQAAMLTAFAKVGLSGDFGGTWFLSQLIGTAKARELYMLSGKVDAAEALRLGLANWICEPGELAGYAAKTAEALANGPTVAFRYIKENLNRAAHADLEDCMDLEATHHVHCMATSDHGEAVAAFAQKREPAFAGR